MIFCSLKNHAEFKFINDFGTKRVTKNLIIIALDFRKVQSPDRDTAQLSFEDSLIFKDAYELEIDKSHDIPKSFFKQESYENLSTFPKIFRLGLKVSRKYGNAVKRNLFKRRVRAIVVDISKTHDITSKALLIIPKQSARHALYQDLLTQIQSIVLSLR
jgi:ribonuclease P protein component